MKIGIDFDDVVVEFVDPLMEFYHRKYGKKVAREEIKFWDWGIYWGIPRDIATQRVDEFHESHNIKEIKALNGALRALKQLLKNDEIFIITGRPARFQSKVEAWLNHYLKQKLMIIHAGEWHKGKAASKAEICRELKIPFLLEDAPSTALDCAQNGIKVILFDKPWNQSVEHENILRVKNWREAMKVIKKLSAIKIK